MVAATIFAAPPTTVWDGIYTAAQAERGKRLYGIYCSSCHGKTLGGGIDGVEQAPALRREGFMLSRGNLGNVFTFMKEWMPRDDPGSMPDAELADVLAYLLQENGFPAGNQQLAGDSQALAAILIESRPR